MPPSLADPVRAHHLAWFVFDGGPELDLGGFTPVCEKRAGRGIL
jgi:hypothetical protein